MSDPLPRFHDAGLVDFAVGPRREARLHLWLAEGGEVFVRFGAIDNFDAVSSFLHGLERPSLEGASLDTVDSLQPTARGWLLALDHGGIVHIETCKPPTVVHDEAG